MSNYKSIVDGELIKNCYVSDLRISKVFIRIVEKVKKRTNYKVNNLILVFYYTESVILYMYRPDCIFTHILVIIWGKLLLEIQHRSCIIQKKIDFQIRVI